MKDEIGYRVRICAIVDEEGTYGFKDEFFDSCDSAYLLYNYITIDGVKDTLKASITPREAYISLNLIDGDGFIIEDKKNKHRVLQRVSR